MSFMIAKNGAMRVYLVGNIHPTPLDDDQFFFLTVTISFGSGGQNAQQSVMMMSTMQPTALANSTMMIPAAADGRRGSMASSVSYVSPIASSVRRDDFPGTKSKEK